MRRTWQRERIVGSRACGAEVTSRTCEVAGGSSRLFNSAFSACSVISWASSITNARARASKGRPPTSRTTSRICSILIPVGQGSTRKKSGWRAKFRAVGSLPFSARPRASGSAAIVRWTRPHVAHRPHASPPAVSQRRARPAASASVLFPTPSGPASSNAGGSRPRSRLRARRPLTRSWPRTSAKAIGPRPRVAPGLDRAQDARRDLVGVALPIEPEPAVRLFVEERQVAAPHALVEFERFALEPVVGAPLADAGQAFLDLDVEEQDEVGA